MFCRISFRDTFNSILIFGDEDFESLKNQWNIDRKKITDRLICQIIVFNFSLRTFNIIF